MKPFETLIALRSILKGTTFLKRKENTMFQTLRFDQDAPGNSAFALLWTQLAAANKTRGIAASTRSGTAQIYAWDVPTGDNSFHSDTSARLPASYSHWLFACFCFHIRAREAFVGRQMMK